MIMTKVLVFKGLVFRQNIFHLQKIYHKTKVVFRIRAMQGRL